MLLHSPLIIPIIACLVRAVWALLELLRVRRHRIAISQEWDKHSALIWDAANAIEAVGIIFGLAGIGTLQIESTTIRLLGLGLLVGGVILRWTAILQLGVHFTSRVTIHHGHRLVQTGIYRYLRHPSYTGALVAHFGFGLSFLNWFSLCCSTLPFLVAAWYRIKVEEIALKEAFGEAYVDYSRHTKKLVPGVF